METKNNEPRRSSTRYLKLLEPANAILTVAIIVALAFLITTSKKNILLSQENERLRLDVSKFGTLRIGDILPPFRATDLFGKPATVGFDSATNHLLFVFSTSCGGCSTQLPAWDELATAAKLEGCTVRGVSVDSADETEVFLSGVESIPALVASPDAFARAYRVRQVPETILVSKEGVVQWVQIGILTKDQIKELLDLIKAKKISVLKDERTSLLS